MLLGSVAVGVVFALVLGHTSSELIGDGSHKVLTQLRGESQLSGEELDKLQVALVPTPDRGHGSLQVTRLLCLMLARGTGRLRCTTRSRIPEFAAGAGGCRDPAAGAVVVPALEVQAAVLGRCAACR